jgi:hypothetical protein
LLAAQIVQQAADWPIDYNNPRFKCNIFASKSWTLLKTKNENSTIKLQRDICRGLLIDEESAEGLVLTLEGELGGEEEIAIRGCCYLIASTIWHILIMLQSHLQINMFLLPAENTT